MDDVVAAGVNQQAVYVCRVSNLQPLKAFPHFWTLQYDCVYQINLKRKLSTGVTGSYPYAMQATILLKGLIYIILI